MPDVSNARSTRKAKGCGHLRRAELLSAAERLFVNEGYERATIRRIADEVGVSSTALYMYFDDKSQILLEIGAKSAVSLGRMFEAIAAGSEEPAIRVQRMLEAMLSFGHDNRYAYQLMFCVAPADLTIRRRETSAALLARCNTMLSDALAELHAQGRLRAGSPALAAKVLWSACHGLLAFPLACPDSSMEPAADIEHLAVEGLLRGLIADIN